MNTKYSPYRMLAEANTLISNCKKNKVMPCECEKQIISLLNTAESYPGMSTYQLSLSHKEMANLYNSLGISGSAIEHYEIALQMNQKISVKQKLKQLKSLPTESLVYSLDANIMSEPDYSNLKSIETKLDEEFIESRREHEKRTAESFGMSVEEYRKMHKDAMNELQEEKNKNDAIYDPKFEKEIEERLSKLGEPYISEFYRNRENREKDSVLSDKELDLLNLEAMERSFSYRKNS